MRRILLLALSLNIVGCQKLAEEQMQDINKKVASDAVEQYEIAKRGGTAMDRCVQAGMVAAAYLQAKDEDNYTTWKATEGADCATAGISR
jgi:hypothetical protein